MSHEGGPSNGDHVHESHDIDPTDLSRLGLVAREFALRPTSREEVASRLRISMEDVWRDIIRLFDRNLLTSERNGKIVNYRAINDEKMRRFIATQRTPPKPAPSPKPAPIPTPPKAPEPKREKSNGTNGKKRRRAKKRIDVAPAPPKPPIPQPATVVAPPPHPPVTRPVPSPELEERERRSLLEFFSVDDATIGEAAEQTDIEFESALRYVAQLVREGKLVQRGRSVADKPLMGIPGKPLPIARFTRPAPVADERPASPRVMSVAPAYERMPQAEIERQYRITARSLDEVEAEFDEEDLRRKAEGLTDDDAETDLAAVPEPPPKTDARIDLFRSPKKHMEEDVYGGKVTGKTQTDLAGILCTVEQRLTPDEWNEYDVLATLVASGKDDPQALDRLKELLRKAHPAVPVDVIASIADLMVRSGSSESARADLRELTERFLVY